MDAGQKEITSLLLLEGKKKRLDLKGKNKLAGRKKKRSNNLQAAEYGQGYLLAKIEDGNIVNIPKKKDLNGKKRVISHKKVHPALSGELVELRSLLKIARLPWKRKSEGGERKK